MARGLNRVTLIGNLGNDPELRYTADGVAMATTSLAVNGFRRSPDGEREESVEWFRLVFFDRQAETISTYGAKGKPLFVEGRLQTRPYADRNGVIRTAIEVIISQFLLLGTANAAHEEDAADVKAEPVETGAAIAAR